MGTKSARMPEAEAFACNTCTWRLVKLCYDRAPWFRLVREPLALGMRAWAWRHGIDPRQASRGHLDCRGCMRYLKDQLKARSWAFRWMNDRIDPVFNRLRDTMVSEDEIEEARVFARQAAGP
ncbi:MAG TPA: nitroreductase [Elusimicrobia bacterium]|nr:nitroreductase [Elusimicrobiota bacterium]